MLIDRINELKGIEVIRVIRDYLKIFAPVVFFTSKELTISEAQALTGWSREFLREVIATEQLKAQVIGKGWRIKRAI